MIIQRKIHIKRYTKRVVALDYFRPPYNMKSAADLCCASILNGRFDQTLITNFYNLKENRKKSHTLNNDTYLGRGYGMNQNNIETTKASFLSSEEKKALYILRRRRRELKRRIEESNGSENSLSFDKSEHKAISIVLNIIDEMSPAEEGEQAKEEIAA